MLLLNYDDWMQKTDLGHFHPRSSRLRRLDDAIKNYCSHGSTPAAFEISKALVDWEKARQLDGNKPSRRNRWGAITELRHQLCAQGYDTASGDLSRIFAVSELQPLEEVRMEQRTALQTTFANAKVIFHPEGLAGPSSDPEWLAMLFTPDAWITEKVTAFTQQVGDAALTKIKEKLHISDQTEQAGRNLKEMFDAILNSVLGDQIWAQIKNTPVGTYISDAITKIKDTLTAMIPSVVSTIWDTRQVALEWGQLAYHARHVFDIGNRKYDLEIGTPTAAINGMRSALRHELGHSAFDASISTASYAGKLAASHADAGAFTGPLITLGAAVGKFAHFLTHLAYQSKAAVEMRLVLQDPFKMGLSAFKSYPLLGAYFIHCTTFSNLVPLSFMGTPGWMDEVERLNRKMDGVFTDARRLINKCPYKIIGLQKIQTFKTDQNTQDDEFWEHIKNAFGSTNDALDDLANTAIEAAA